MRKFLPFLLFVSLFSSAFGQQVDNLSRHTFSVDFGSYRGRYIYPMTNLKYSSPLLWKSNFKFSTRIRSYGTLFFYTKSAYDVTPLVEYYFSKSVRPIYFSAGIGVDGRLRFVQDQRSEATTSAEPMVSFAVHGNKKRVYFSVPLWSRFYSNGISVSLLPELSYQASDAISLFIRYEWSYLKIYHVSTHEWRHDFFLGANILF